MEFPEGIEAQILEYLHREFGETPGSPEALQLSDIEYEGVYSIAGVETHYFRFKTVGGHNWATVETRGSSLTFGMTSDSPRPVPKSTYYKNVSIDIPESETRLELPLEDFGEGGYGFSDYNEVELPDGRSFQLLVEAYTRASPVPVTIGIIDGENEIYSGGYVGLSLSYESQTVGYITVSIGPDL